MILNIIFRKYLYYYIKWEKKLNILFLIINYLFCKKKFNNKLGSK